MSIRGALAALGRLRAHERVFAVSVSTALVMTGQGILGPVLPLFAQRMGLSVAAVGVAVASFGLARLIFNVPIGILADARGRKLLLVGGPLVVSVGMIGSAMSASLAPLVVWRFVAGVGSAMYMTGALVYLADVSEPANRARLLGVNQGALLIGTAIGPVIGGLLADRFGFEAPFYVVAAATAAASLYALFRLEETRPAKAAHPHRAGLGRAHIWQRLLTSPPFVAVLLVNLVVFLTRGTTRNTLLPLAGADEFGMSLAEIGLLLSGMALINIVLLAPATMAADRYGRSRVIVPSLFGTAAGLTVLALAGDIGVFVAGAGVLALATSVAGPAPAAFAADVVGEESRGAALGLFRTAGDLGLLAGPPLLGLVADSSGYGWAFGINAMLVVIAGVVFLFVVRGRVVR